MGGYGRPVLQQSTAASLSARVRAEQSSSRLPSLVAGVVRRGSLVWADAVGRVDGTRTGEAATVETQYRIGSITKTFVAVLVLRLADEGRVGLDDRLDRHVPGTAFGRATIAQLLSHAAGLQAETDGPWWERTPGASWEALVGSLTDQPLRHPPGRRFHYSNVGFAALGELVARVRGEGWDQVLRHELLEPLGMTRTTTRPLPPAAPGLAVHPYADLVLPEPEHDAGAMGPAGQLWSTVPDLGRWAAFLAGATAGLLEPDTLTAMLAPIVVDDIPDAAWTSAYGLGLQLWNVEGRRYAGHGGSMPGFLATLRFDVASGDGVVLATNTTAGLSRTFPADLLDLLQAAEPLDPPLWHTTDVAAQVLELAGAWHWGPAPFVLRVLAAGGFELGPAGAAGRASRFRPTGPDTWVGLDGYYTGEPLRVVRQPDGAVACLDLASFRFTRNPYGPADAVPGGVDPAGWR